MRSCVLCLPFAAALLAASVAVAADGKAAAPPLPRLIADLGSPDFTQREEATRALDALGAPALDELRKATTSSDAEVRRRARELVAKLERRQETARLLQPRRVHLIFKDTPVGEAVAEFSRQAGFTLDLGYGAGLAERKVTLDTGGVPFWEAFDQFCRAAGLVEAHLLPDAGNGPRQPDDNGARQAKERALFANPYQPYGGAYDRNRLVLVDGKAPNLPTFLAGALRLRLLPAHVQLSVEFLGDGEKVLPLEVTPEPGVAWRGLVSLQVSRAIDDRGQALTQAMVHLGDGTDAAMNPYLQGIIWDGAGYYNPYGIPAADPRQVPVRLKMPARPGKVIRELHGTLTAQAQTPPEALVEVDDVLKAAGRAVPGARGGSLKVIEVSREANGRVRLQLQVQAPDGRPRPRAHVLLAQARIHAAPALLPLVEIAQR